MTEKDPKAPSTGEMIKDTGLNALHAVSSGVASAGSAIGGLASSVVKRFKATPKPVGAAVAKKTANAAVPKAKAKVAKPKPKVHAAPAKKSAPKPAAKPAPRAN